MNINTIFINTFRNINSLQLSFCKGVNFITGKNGSGKTNILESIYYLSTLKSFRRAKDSDIIMDSKKSFFLKMDTEGDENSFEVGCIFNNKKAQKKYKISGVEVKRAIDYFGRINTVVYSPYDIFLVDGSNDIKRKYFDSVISKIDREYLEIIIKYSYFIKVRNETIRKYKDDSKNRNYIDFLDDKISEMTENIIIKRNNFIKKYNYIFQKSSMYISNGEENPSIVYKSIFHGLNIDEIKKDYKRNLNRDIESGYTHNSLNKDIYSIFSENGKEYTVYCSQGQKRTASISIKDSEREIIENVTGKKAVVLIDDVFSELDQNRKNRLLEMINKGNQVLIAVVSIDDHLKEYFKIRNCIEIYKGNIVA